MNRIKDRQRIGESSHISRTPLDVPASLAGMLASETDHLGREIDRRDASASLGKCDCPLTSAAAGVKNARIPVQPQRVPDAIELRTAIRRQRVRLGPGIPTLGAGVPRGARALKPAVVIIVRASGIEIHRWRTALAAR